VCKHARQHGNLLIQSQSKVQKFLGKLLQPQLEFAKAKMQLAWVLLRVLQICMIQPLLQQYRFLCGFVDDHWLVVLFAAGMWPLLNLFLGFQACLGLPDAVSILHRLSRARGDVGVLPAQLLCKFGSF